MSNYNKSQAPYYDDYDSTKQYTHLLAIPGRVAQAREITQLQSVVKDIVKSLGDSILKDGNIIEGCQVIVNSEKNMVTVTEGKVYIEGMVLPIKESTAPIRGIGTEIVGIKLVESVITEVEDPTLRDPAQGYDNYNQPGCHRIKSELRVVINDEDASKLVRLEDGDITVEQIAPEYDKLSQTLARRTYDESGSYVVNGLKVRVESHRSDNTKFNIVIEPGKAYVLGYELKIPAARRITVPRALTSINVNVTNYIYKEGVNVYQLDSAPFVKDIVSAIGDMRRTLATSISSNTDQITLGEDISLIESIKYGDEEYEQGVDYSLVRISGAGTQWAVKWNGTDHFPTLNSQFIITYRQKYRFVQGTDYELYHDLSSDSHNIKWLDGGEHPLAETYFSVNYDQYLARKDTVYIDQNGEINVIQGTPAGYGYEPLPDAPINTLALAYVMSPPGGAAEYNSNISIAVSNVGLTRYTMKDIQDIVGRIKTLEYDQATLSLNTEAKEYDTTSSKRGIFTDPLIDLSKLDLYYNLNNKVILDENKPIFDVNVDLGDNICFLPIEGRIYDPIYSSDSTSNIYTRGITLKKTDEKILLSQMNATKSFLINPYSIYPQMPEIYVDPAVDMWYDDTIIEIPVSKEANEVVETTTRNVTATSGSGNMSRIVKTTSTETTQIGTRIDESAAYSITSEEPITYMRQRDVTVIGSSFPPNLDNIQCFFDDVEVSMSPLEDTAAGTISGTVKANNDGNFKATFKIPEGIQTGMREVRVASNIIVDGYMNSAFTYYVAQGTARTIQKTVTTVTTVLLQRVITNTTTTQWYQYDPLAQTFMLDKMTLLSGIDVYFESKPDNGNPVTCELREVSDGVITHTVYASKTLSSYDVNVSSDSSVATRFYFDDPALLEEGKEYAFVLRSTSTRYRAWIAEIGENDIVSGNRVLANPYLTGVMMSSSNNSSWTTHQTSDVKFRLIADTYDTSSEVVFDSITKEEGFSRIYLKSDAVVPNNTSVNWFYSLDDGETYSSITPYRMINLNQMYTTIKIKAKLNRGSMTSLTPILAKDAIALELSNYDELGYYVSKKITGLDEYTKVDVVLDTYIPNTGTKLSVFISTDEETMIPLEVQSTEVRNLNYGWREQVYRAEVPEATQCRVYIKLESNSPTNTPAFRRLRAIMY